MSQIPSESRDPNRDILRVLPHPSFGYSLPSLSLHSMYCIPACNLFGCSPSSELLFRDALDNSSRAFLYSLQLMRKEEKKGKGKDPK